MMNLWVYHNKDLGIYFDSSLSFNDHYSYILNKASSMLGFINRFSSDPKALKSLFCPVSTRVQLYYMVSFHIGFR